MTIPMLPTPIRSNEIQPADSITALIYGETGVGKTRFCQTIGDNGLIIETGAGAETLTSPDVRKLGNPLVIDVHEEFDPKTGIFKLAKAFDLVCEIIDHYLLDPEIKTICIDDATFLNKFAANKALEINSSSNKSKSLVESRASGLIQMAIQDYGTQMNIIDWFLSMYVPEFKKANKNFILTAHDRLTYSKGDKIGDNPTLVKISPGFVGQTFPDSVPAYFDWCWRMESVSGGDSIKYRFRTVGDETITAKTRHSKVFKVLEDDMNFLHLVQRLKESQTINLIKK